MIVRVFDGSDAGQSSANAAGEYIVTGLSSGSYKIVATLNGYETGIVDEAKITSADITIPSSRELVVRALLDSAELVCLF